ncbi:GntR family transcriptional regulator [Spiractinospora alimapuensis]|uniref:GntR family transcriptional regulator n=1 Tax=Spiractinospora alimapuensis TaxID=2820884 RepID=UPI001F255E64|nr:GntR family transcriptional regulator [Spiractinospora alimapuensis]QVQ50055.1 GntR family transcriptional regulator [Spiractinospora alimapuensis]
MSVSSAETTVPHSMRLSSPPSMTQLATDAVRSMILSGTLSPGDRVVESRLTELLGVSRPPLREALRVLEQEGLIEQLPRRGARVPPITLQDIYEIYSLREGLEEMALGLALPVQTPARLERVRAALNSMREAASVGDEGRFTERAFEFHTAIVALAGNHRLEMSYRSVANQIRLCMAMNRRARQAQESLEADCARHQEVLDALEAGVPEDACQALRTHGHRTFLLSVEPDTAEASPQAIAWLREVQRAEGGIDAPDV